MKQQEFIINSRFLVMPSSNTFRDLQVQKELRLEARLMHLLCLLADANEEVVTRDRIIKEIWNDYGGGDEGLSQAIFYLRKALEDTSKEIIETIPKKGYVLHATITDVKNDDSVPKQKKRKFIIPILLAVTAAIALYIILDNLAKTERLLQKEPAEIPFPDLSEDNHSITTVDTNGTKYKLVQVGDSRPVLYVNGRRIGIEEQEQYMLLINKMSESLQKTKQSQRNEDE